MGSGANGDGFYRAASHFITSISTLGDSSAHWLRLRTQRQVQRVVDLFVHRGFRLILPPDHLGLPADPHSWTAFFLFWLAHISIIIAMFAVQFVARCSLLKGILTTIVFALLAMTEIMAPPSVTLIDVYSRKPSQEVLPYIAGDCGDPGVTPIFAHISDLHITDHTSTRDGRNPGNARLPSLLESINKLGPPFVVISGDLTDEGGSEQWRLVEQLFQPLRANTKVFVSTGNHDLNYFFGRDPEEHPWTWFGLRPLVGLGAEPRIFRAAKFQARHLQDVRTSSGRALQDVVANTPNASNLASFPQQVEECAISCIWNSDGDPGQVKLAIGGCRASCSRDVESVRFHYFRDLAESFPMYYIDDKSHTAFVSLTTSMGETTAVGRNAIGLTGEQQISNFKAELAKLPSDVKYIVVVQHHPLLWKPVPPFPHFHWRHLLHLKKSIDAFYTSPWFLAVFLHNNFSEEDRIYTTLKDELAKRAGSSALVAFGHRHQRSLGRIDSVIFEEAPNLATDSADDYGFYLVGTKANALNVSWGRMDAN